MKASVAVSPHYDKHSVQPIDVMEEYLTPDELAGFMWGNIIKYALRWKDKGGVEDLRKCQDYCARLIERLDR